MAHPHHCLGTPKLQSTYFSVLYAYFIIGPNVRSHYDLYTVGTSGGHLKYIRPMCELTSFRNAVYPAMCVEEDIRSTGTACWP